MKLRVSAYILFLICILLMNCASPNTQLKKEHPELFEDITGTWYILSNDKLGEPVCTLSFNEDGTVTGETLKFFGYTDALWTIKVYTVHGWKRKKGLLAVYRADTTNSIPTRADKIIFTKDKKFFTDTTLIGNYTHISVGAIDKIYLDNVPPLGIMEVEWELLFKKKKTFLFSRDLQTINEIKEIVATAYTNEQELWAQINKNSIKEHIKFIKIVKNTNLKAQAEDSLHSLLDKKIIKYMQNKNNSFTKFLDHKIILQDGTEICKLKEFLRNPILYIDQNTGEKLNLTFKNNESYPNTFDIDFSKIGSKGTISFKPFKNRLVVIGMKKGSSVNPPGWEYTVPIIAKNNRQYPAIDNIDVDLLENL